MLTFEFTVPGPPLSHQARDRQKLATWRAVVRAAAFARWGTHVPIKVSLRMTVVYYHRGEFVRIDNDNLVKPIQDSLNGLVYEDDGQITDVAVRKSNINGAFRICGASLVLLTAFHEGREFVHVRVEPASDHSDLLR